MTTVMQPFPCDLQPRIPKHPITMHTQAHPKQLEATVTMRQKKPNRPQPHPPHRRGTFHRWLQPLYTEKHKVSCSGFLPNTKPMQQSCRHYNAFRSITSQTCTYNTYILTWQHQMTTVMQPFPCDLQPQIPKHPITMHTQAHPKQLEATVTMRQKKKPNRPQPHPPHRRGTFHRWLQPLYTEKRTVSCQSHHFPSSPLLFLTTSHRHHFPSSPLPFVTTSLHNHFPLPHHFPSSPLPFVITFLPHHFPSSPLPFITTSLPHHFPSSPFPFVTTSLRHHYSFVMYCYVMYHPSSRSIPSGKSHS